MHQALRIPEILRYIIRYLHPSGDEDFQHSGPSLAYPGNLSNRDAKPLIRAALVCTSFSEPALDYLWWFMHDLTPLFRLLPAFIPASKHIKFSFFNGEILTGDLKRFNSYAGRIRCYDMTGRERFHASTIARILRECDRMYLLPGLQILTVDSSSSTVLSFIPPNLRRFEASVESKSSRIFHEIHSCITSLPSSTPDLSCLLIASDLSAEALTAIAQLPRLAKLRISGFSSKYPVRINLLTILRMSSAPTLRFLDLATDVGFEFLPLPTSFSALERTIFSSLTDLEITIGSRTMSALCAFLGWTSLPRLEHLCVQLLDETYQWTETERRRWLDFLCRLPEVTSMSLRRLRVLSADFGGVAFQSTDGLSLHDVFDLGSLDLINVEITAPFLKPISLTSLKHITQCWPHLQVLDLRGDDNPILEFHSLIILAQNLPNLDDLTMRLPSRKDIAIGEIPILNHGLSSIDFSYLEAPSPEEFVRALDRLFPNLTFWEFCGLNDAYGSGIWEDVSRLLWDIQAARKDRIECEHKRS